MQTLSVYTCLVELTLMEKVGKMDNIIADLYKDFRTRIGNEIQY